MIRWLEAIPRIAPKLVLLPGGPSEPFGLPKFVSLNILKNSARNCTLMGSRTGKFLKMPRSVLRKSGPWKGLRPRLPNW